jgi:hypothetical protein
MTSAFDKPSDMMTGVNNVGQGWHQLIKDLETELNTIDSNFELLQVKEKFGGLRYYAELSAGGSIVDSQLFHEHVHQAEERSFHHCEVCGEAGIVRSVKGWLKTLCEKHLEEREARVP